MSPKTYTYLSIIFLASAGVLALAGYLSMLTLVVYGFVAFGIIFMGMMCVLPAQSAHHYVKTEKVPADKAARPVGEVAFAFEPRNATSPMSLTYR